MSSLGLLLLPAGDVLVDILNYRVFGHFAFWRGVAENPLLRLMASSWVAHFGFDGRIALVPTTSVRWSGVQALWRDEPQHPTGT
jgi:hypothetical protein